MYLMNFARHNDCVRMDALIQQILDYSKLEKGNPSPEACDINALCERIADDMAVHYPGIPLTLNCEPNVTISGYAEALHQALENIIGNACKYSSRGELVEVSTEKRSNTAVITVRDHGPGVDSEEIEKLLQPFYRAGNQMHTSGCAADKSVIHHVLPTIQSILNVEARFNPDINQYCLTAPLQPSKKPVQCSLKIRHITCLFMMTS